MSDNICKASNIVNPDIAGIGIRIGVYLQIFSISLALFSKSRKINSILEPMIWMYVTLSIIFIINFSKSFDQVIGNYIILSMTGLYSLGISNYFLINMNKKIINIIYLISTFVSSCLGLVFYVKISNILINCQPIYVFFFAKVNIDGWYRIFSIVFISIILLYNTIYYLPIIIKNIFSESNNELKDINIYVGIMNIIYISLFICSIELTIKWNNINWGTNELWGFGQIISLMMGAVNIIIVVYDIIKNCGKTR